MIEEFRHKQRMRRILYSRVTLVCLFVLAVFLCVQVYEVYEKERAARRAVALVEAEYTELQVRSKELEDRLRRLQTEYGLEEEIRERYGVAKPGEEVIMLLDPEGGSVVSEEQPGLWKRFLELFR